MEKIGFIFALFIAVFLVFRIIKNRTLIISKVVGEVVNFMSLYSLRGSDDFGSGAFGASRGSKSHQGTDVRYNPYENVKAPFDCYINRIGKPYANDSRYDLVEITGVNKFKGYKAKLMYVTPIAFANPNLIYKQGQTVGTSQDISAKYNTSTRTMINHMHLEIRNEKNQLVNPEQYA